MLLLFFKTINNENISICNKVITICLVLTILLFLFLMFNYVNFLDIIKYRVDGYTIRTEVSYLNGKIVPYGTKGSARIDAALYDSHGQLVHAYDLKTGGASLSTNQIRHIQTQTRSKINVTKITGQ